MIYSQMPARRCRAGFFGVGRRKPDNSFIQLGYRPEQIWRHRGEKRCCFQRPNLLKLRFAPPAFAVGTFLTLLWKSAHRATTRLTWANTSLVRSATISGAQGLGSAFVLFDYCEPIFDAQASSMDGISADRITSIISLAARVKPSLKASSSVTLTTSLKASSVF